MKDMLYKGKGLMASEKAKRKEVLTSMLVQAPNGVDGENVEDKGSETKFRKFTINEILGNVSVICFAGHETTDNTLA